MVSPMFSKGVVEEFKDNYTGVVLASGFFSRGGVDTAVAERFMMLSSLFFYPESRESLSREYGI